MFSDIDEITCRMFELTINDERKGPGRPRLHRAEEEKREMQRQYSRKYYGEHQDEVTNRIRIYKELNRENIRDKAKLAYHAKKARSL